MRRIEPEVKLTK